MSIKSEALPFVKGAVQIDADGNVCFDTLLGTRETRLRWSPEQAKKLAQTMLIASTNGLDRKRKLCGIVRALSAVED